MKWVSRGGKEDVEQLTCLLVCVGKSKTSGAGDWTVPELCMSRQRYGHEKDRMSCWSCGIQGQLCIC